MPMRVFVPVGFAKPLTRAHENLCPYVRVWVYAGAGAGLCGCGCGFMRVWVRVALENPRVARAIP